MCKFRWKCVNWYVSTGPNESQNGVQTVLKGVGTRSTFYTYENESKVEGGMGCGSGNFRKLSGWTGPANWYYTMTKYWHTVCTSVSKYSNNSMDTVCSNTIMQSWSVEYLSLWHKVRKIQNFSKVTPFTCTPHTCTSHANTTPSTSVEVISYSYRSTLVQTESITCTICSQHHDFGDMRYAYFQLVFEYQSQGFRNQYTPL